MKRVTDFPKVFLCRAFTDMRKQINGLTLIVEQQMRLSPFEKALFVFLNRRRDIMKVVYWDETGFALWCKRLDKDKFFWPKKMREDVISISSQQMEWLLLGYNIWQMKQHKSLHFETVT